MPDAGHRFFANTACRYFPCHAGADPARFNCLFCYCPLYAVRDCGGSPVWKDDGVKDCSACLRPHDPEAYASMIEDIRRFVTRPANPGEPGGHGP